MQVNVYTDNKDFGIISVENYLVGDTDNYQLVEDVGRYNCDPGAVYSSSVSLKVSYMLSTSRKKTDGIRTILVTTSIWIPTFHPPATV